MRLVTDSGFAGSWADPLVLRFVSIWGISWAELPLEPRLFQT